MLIIACTCVCMSIVGFPVDYRTHDHTVCIHTAATMTGPGLGLAGLGPSRSESPQAAAAGSARI